jgi:hypothetical protein
MMMSYEQLIETNMRAESGYLVLVLLAVGLALLLYRVNPLVRVPPLSIASLMLAGAILRLPPLLQSFWYDETFTGVIARLSLSEAWRVIRSDVHPPLMYALQWLIAHTIGSNEQSLRLLPFIFGVWAIYAIYKLGALYNQRVAQGAALLLAVSPPMVWYSAEARQYTLLLLVVLISLRALKTRDNLLTAGALFVLPWLHSYGYIYAGLLGLYGLFNGIKPRWLALSSVGGLAWLPFMLAQSGDVSDGAFWIPPPTVGGVVKIITDTTLGNSFPPSVALLLFLPVLAVLLLALVRTREKLLLIVVVGVPGAAAVLSVLWSPVWLPRAMLPVGAVLLLAVALHFQQRAALYVITLVLMIGTGYIAAGESTRANMREYVAACGDAPIYTMSISNAIIARYYSSAPVYVYPSPANYDQWLSPDALKAVGVEPYDTKRLPPDWCLFVVDTPAMSFEQRSVASLLRAGHYQRLYDHPVMRVEITNGSS